MARPGMDLAEGVKLRRPWKPEERVPPVRPNPITQESCPSWSRNPTAPSTPARSPQSDRTAARFSAAGFTVTIRKIAARVSGATTGCGRTPDTVMCL